MPVSTIGAVTETSVTPTSCEEVTKSHSEPSHNTRSPTSVAELAAPVQPASTVPAVVLIYRSPTVGGLGSRTGAAVRSTAPRKVRPSPDST